MTPSTFRKKVKNSPFVENRYLEKTTYWDHRAGNYNPVINEMICNKFDDLYYNQFFKGNGYPVIYLPFAGVTHGSLLSIDFLNKKFDVIAHDLYEVTGFTKIVDSTETGPDKKPDVVILHPPYFGSCDFTPNDKRVEKEKSLESYLEKIKKSIINCGDHDFHIILIARPYENKKKHIDLDYLFFKICEGLGFHLVEINRTTPDNVIIMKRGSK